MTFRFTGGSSETGVPQIFQSTISNDSGSGSFAVANVSNEGVVIDQVIVKTVSPSPFLNSLVVNAVAGGGSGTTVSFITGSLASGSNYSNTGSQTAYAGLVYLDSGDVISMDFRQPTGIIGPGPPNPDIVTFDLLIRYYALQDGATIVSV